MAEPLTDEELEAIRGRQRDDIGCARRWTDDMMQRANDRDALLRHIDALKRENRRLRASVESIVLDALREERDALLDVVDAAPFAARPCDAAGLTPRYRCGVCATCRLNAALARLDEVLRDTEVGGE